MPIDPRLLNRDHLEILNDKERIAILREAARDLMNENNDEKQLLSVKFGEFAKNTIQVIGIIVFLIVAFIGFVIGIIFVGAPLCVLIVLIIKIVKLFDKN
ncbi:hypothetical protein JW926_14885 [Candidatus Sumerlaeota bacterium]|nr:hypothetical protein [Candidatus Sumerlaeota bacterium]